jgi:hypothetical protein
MVLESQHTKAVILHNRLTCRRSNIGPADLVDLAEALSKTATRLGDDGDKAEEGPEGTATTGVANSGEGSGGKQAMKSRKCTYRILQWARMVLPHVGLVVLLAVHTISR